MMTRTQDFNLTVRCELDDEYFQDWNSLSPELKAFWDELNNICNCDGTGEMSTWCKNCVFCEVFEIEES